MKVLIVANYNPGRFAPFVTEQVDSLRKLGINFDFYGIVGKGPLGYLKNLPGLKRKIREYKPDLIHAHYGLSGLLATLQRKVPVVVTFHNGETLSKGINLLSSIAAKRADYVIYVAQHIYDRCYMKAKKYSIIPCGVNLDDLSLIPYGQARKESGFKDGTKYILFGGAFDNLRKNYPLLKQAIDRLPEKESIECIEMKGLNRREITRYMCAVDCFALPTKSEGSPQALKEAMGCDCPIIATDVADIKYLLGDLPGHYICSFNPEDVAKKLAMALDFNNRTKGRERIVKLGLSNGLVARRIHAIYEEILNS